MRTHLFRDSIAEFKKPQALAGAALLIALSIILSAYCQIRYSNWLQIGFTYLSESVMSMFFGPAIALVGGIIEDVASFFIFPDGAFFPGYTLSTALACLTYGLCFYYCKVNLKRVLLAKGIVNVFINIGLGTLWASILVGKSFLAILPMRALKNLIAYPIEVGLLYALLQGMIKLKPHLQRRS